MVKRIIKLLEINGKKLFYVQNYKFDALEIYSKVKEKGLIKAIDVTCVLKIFKLDNDKIEIILEEDIKIF